MLKIAFRVDASLNIGIGHVMRCLALAEKLQKHNVDILFICRDLNGNIIKSIEDREFEVQILQKPEEELSPSEAHLHSNWLQVNQEQDANDCSAILKEYFPDWLIIDHYSIDHQWERKLRPFAKKILVIDDLANRRHTCDMLLDQTYGVQTKNYASLVPRNCHIFTGSEYALLRSEFALKRSEALDKRNKCKKINSILISFGGIDKNNLSLLSLKACELLYPKYKLKIDLIIGSQNPHIANLNEYILHSNQKVVTHIDSSNMAELMISADLAIGAGGTTSWERCTLALPTIAISLAENQMQIIKGLTENNAIVNVGNFKSVTIEKMSMALRNVIESPSLYKEMQLKSSSICDGNGAERISNKLLNNIK